MMDAGQDSREGIFLSLGVAGYGLYDTLLILYGTNILHLSVGYRTDNKDTQL